jgi:hypothetical protein
MILMRKIITTLGLALAGLTTFKTTIQHQKSAAAEAAFVAKAKKHYKVKKMNSDDDEDEDEIDITTDLGFYKAILKELGVRETAEKIKFLMAWRQGEGGKAKNNPFNTSKHIPGTVDSKYNSHGVRNYPDRKTGLDATVATLRLPFYKEILDLLKKDSVTAHELAHTKALKRWGTGDMVKKVLMGENIDPPPIA